jgi:hypothetical protein
MKNKCEVTDPGTFYYVDAEVEWLGINIEHCSLEACDILWVKTCYPRRQGDRIRPAPSDLKKENSIRLPFSWAYQRLLPHGPDDSRTIGGSGDTVWFGLDIHDINRQVQNDLGAVRYLLIPCNAMEEKKVPGFGRGCIP